MSVLQMSSVGTKWCVEISLWPEIWPVSPNSKNRVPSERLRWNDIATSFVPFHTGGAILPEVYIVSTLCNSCWKIYSSGGKHLCVCVCVWNSTFWWLLFRFYKVRLLIWFGLEGMKQSSTYRVGMIKACRWIGHVRRIPIETIVRKEDHITLVF